MLNNERLIILQTRMRDRARYRTFQTILAIARRNCCKIEISNPTLRPLQQGRHAQIIIRKREWLLVADGFNRGNFGYYIRWNN
jgi:hypothetical protein